MHQVVNKYQEITVKSIENQKKYGLLLQNQSWGHLYLIKYIAAALAFEAVNYERRKKTSNLEKYRMPI